MTMLPWAAIAVLSALLWLTIQSISSKQSTIPTVPGLPVLGNVVALGKGGLAFITQCRQRYGDVFCLRLLGQRMVFVFDPAMLSLFFKAPESSISFKPAVEQFTQRIYGLPSSEFFPRHEDLLATLRQLLVPAQLQDMGTALLQYAQPQVEAWEQQGKVELWSACQSLVFGAAGQVLFGAAFFKRHGLEAVQEAFLKFEGNFEVAASPIPHLLLPKFRSSRSTLLQMLSKSLAMGDFEGTVVVQLLHGSDMPQRLWPNLLLTLLWASQANSMPAMFWSLALLLLPEHAKARARVRQELQDTANSKRQQQQQQQQVPVRQGLSAAVDGATMSAMLQLAMDRRSWVSRCVAEAIRLRLHSIAVRFVSDAHLILPRSQRVKTTSSNSSSSNGSIDGKDQPDAQQGSASSSGQPGKGLACQAGMHVPRGSILCICPIESHHDPRLYPDEPWAFKPDREPIQGLTAGTVVPGVAGMGFGGGLWRCPGRFFAEMELALLLQLVLLQLELTQEQQQQQQQQKDPPTAKYDSMSQQYACQKSSSSFMQRVLDVTVFGLGMRGGSSKQEQQWQRSGVEGQLFREGKAAAADGRKSVARLPRLPKSDLRRLVGLKVPAEPWWVTAAGVLSKDVL